MSDPRFDLKYTGVLAPGADPDQARQRLSAIFKLSEQGAERLFTGQPVVVKRDVDADTAARFQKIFAQAGAVLTIVPVAGTPPIDPDDATVTAAPAPRPGGGATPLALAPQGILEAPPEPAPPRLDTGYLSVVAGDDWSLQDCAPPPTAIPEPDIGYLSLAPADTDDHTQPNPDSTQQSQ